MARVTLSKQTSLEGTLGIGIALASVTAFGFLGIALGIFRVGDALRSGLNRVADAFSLIDDEDDEEDAFPEMDDAGFDIDDETAEQFQGIVKDLAPLEKLARKIVREESA
jgi:hypothetical protein